MSEHPAAEPLRRAAEPLRRVAARLHRPAELTERTRWLFLACGFGALVLTVLTALPGLTLATSLLLGLGTAGFLVSWLHRYRTRRVPPAFDLLDVLAALLVALACSEPAIAFVFAFPALWYRALYGQTRRIAWYAVGMALAFAGSVLVWTVVPGHTTATSAAPVLGALPVMLLTVGVARHLAVGLFEREQDQSREAALAALGGQLLGVIDRRQIMEQASATAEAICEATPGLRAAMLHRDDDALRIVGAGGFLRPPTTLPLDILPSGLTAKEPLPITPSSSLVLSSGIRGEWLCLAMPDEPESYMLLGAVPTVPRAAVFAAQSMLNQVALALRTSTVHRELKAQALTDGLTGLANRSAFTAAMNRALNTPGYDGWVLFLDLDDFKMVNDSLGHLAGDRLLAHLGTLLTSTVRSEDVCARLGGDEFAVLLQGASEDDARRIGQRIVQLISAPVQLEEGRARIGASVGATRLVPGTTENLVVHQADLAMYAAKGTGKNRVQFFHPGLLQVDDSKALEAELRAAIDGGELVLAYQPLVSSINGACTGVEALVRWNHPTRGLLGPGSFLPLAEETGAIIALGERVMRQACTDAADWDDEAMPVPVHVNASPTQLAHPHFVDLVRESLAEAGLAPERLLVEVTETTVLDSPAVTANIEELVRLGVGIALDDFGTGYSALTTLRSMPISMVKIDKSFVAGALTNAADQAVVQAIVQMADFLNLHTVAEGVESIDQQAWLEAAGLDSLQGYLYLTPAPVAEFSAWLADRRRVAAGEFTLG